LAAADEDEELDIADNGGTERQARNNNIGDGKIGEWTPGTPGAERDPSVRSCAAADDDDAEMMI
jgi:hypothetical protein